MKVRNLLLTVACVISFFAFAHRTSAQCVQCENDLAVMSGHGAASSLPASINPNFPAGSHDAGRRVITIRIDSSWNVNPSGTATPGNTNVNVWNAVQCALNQWNTRQDASGYTTGYYFIIDQSGQVSSQADITVTRQTLTGGGFASSNGPAGYPYTLYLDPRNGNMNGGAFQADDLCGRVSHEVGHLIGLYATDFSCTSIMSGTDSTGNRSNNTVSSADVGAVNQQFNDATRSTCTASVHDPNPTDEPVEGGGDPGGGDPGGGDPCAGDPCCGAGSHMECIPGQCYWSDQCDYWDPYTNTCYGSSEPDYCDPDYCYEVCGY